MKFQNVKGTRDFYPDDMRTLNWLIDAWRRVSRRHGFVEYGGPTFEYLDLYTAKSGDGIVSELFSFEDRGGRRLALRPEMTPTLARMVAARASALPKPIKWFSVPSFFRAENPQRGRLREFYQWNVDIIGTPPDADTMADAECIGVAVDFLVEAGFTPQQVEVRISSRNLMGQVLAALGVPPVRLEAAYAVLDKRDKVPADAFAAGLGTLGLTAEGAATLSRLAGLRGPPGLALAAELLDQLPPDASPVRAVAAVLDILQDMKIADFCVFDPGVVRGLAYYTGTVFEIYSTGTLKRAICGGGRYDGLLREVGGPEMSAVGFGMGDVVLLDQLLEVGWSPPPAERVTFFVVCEDPTRMSEVLPIASLVRRELREPCNYSYRRGSLRKQMQEAAACQARCVIIIGDRLSVKAMDSQAQWPLTFNGPLRGPQDCAALQAELAEALERL